MLGSSLSILSNKECMYSSALISPALTIDGTKCGLTEGRDFKVRTPWAL